MIKVFGFNTKVPMIPFNMGMPYSTIVSCCGSRFIDGEQYQKYAKVQHHYFNESIIQNWGVTLVVNKKVETEKDLNAELFVIPLDDDEISIILRKQN